MPAVRASNGMAFTMFTGKPISSSTAAIGMETFMTSGLPQTLAMARRNCRARATTLISEFENALGARVKRTVHGMAKARGPAARALNVEGHLLCNRLNVTAGKHLGLRFGQQLGTKFSGTQDHRAATQQSGSKGALQRAGIGGERHARGN